MYKWVKSNTSLMIVTIYPSNLTLNSLAAEYFENIRWCMIGIDNKGMKLAIKPVTKREVDLKVFPSENLHKVSIGKGYARISSKNIINELSELLNLNLDGHKFNCDFDEREKLLIVDLKQPV
ncbi:MAG: hypothetical protein GX675_01740 [Erysipelotrichaceae bacterium]|nr:hypothetical protein [Erysipelotrichaceae bacterium]